MNITFQHYQKDADGLCTQLVQCISKDTKQYEGWKCDPESEVH